MEDEQIEERDVDRVLSKSSFRDTRVFRRTLGNDLLDTVSNNVVASSLDAVSELVANSYDADAEHVTIQYEPGRQLVITDDGVGMSPDEIENFYRVGDSAKKGTTTKKGRSPLGSFGIATLAIRNLGGAYVLTTVKGGDKTVVTEKFKGMLTLDQRLNALVLEARREHSGTAIKISELRASEDTGFTPEQLTRHLAWTMPLDSQNFSIKVNGTQITAKPIENARRFSINETGQYMGPVTGAIFFTGRPVKEAGVHIKVNGRRIGDPTKVINMGEMKNTLVKRTVIFVNADGLEKHIRSDRGGFQPSPAYEELCKTLKEKLREVMRYAAQRQESKSEKVLKAKGESVLKEILARGRAAGVAEFSWGYKLEFSDEKSTNVPGYVSARDKVIVVNRRHPMLAATNVTNINALRQSLQTMIADILAANRIKLKRPDEFWKNKNEVYSALQLKRKKAEQEEIFPSAHYTMADLASSSGVTLPTIRYLADQRVLKPGEDNEVIGRDFMAVRKKTMGLTSLPDFVKRYFSQVGSEYVQRERLEKIFGMMGPIGLPFVVNLGTSGKPCYFIEAACERDIARVTSARNMDLRDKTADPAGAIRQVGSEYIVLKSMAKRLGASYSDTEDVLDYAEQHNIPIKSKKSRGRHAGTAYHLAGFVRAVQHRRSSATK